MNSYYQEEEMLDISTSKDNRFLIKKKVIICEEGFFKNERNVLEIQNKLKNLVKFDDLKKIDNIEINHKKNKIELSYFLVYDKKNYNFSESSCLNGETIDCLNIFIDYYEKCTDTFFKNIFIKTLNDIKSKKNYSLDLEEKIKEANESNNEYLCCELMELKNSFNMDFPYNDFNQENIKKQQKENLTALCNVYNTKTKDVINIKDVFDYFKLN